MGFKGPRGEINALSWGPLGRKLVTGSRDGKLRVWDLLRRKSPQFLPLKAELQTSAWSPSGLQVAAAFADGSVQIIDARDGRLLPALGSLAPIP